MQWTTRKSYRIFTTRCIISALSCVLLLGISPPAVANDLTNDVSFIRAQLETLLADLNSGVSSLSGDLVGIQNGIANKVAPLLPLVQGQGNTLSSVLDALNGSSSLSIGNRLQDLQYMINGGGLYQYENIFGYLNEIAQNTANSGSTNIYNVQVDARDILAGNPWWFTNSTFTLTKSMYSYVYPNGSQQGQAYHSFPQFMSKWSSLLTYPQSAGTVTPANMKNLWFDTFGVSRQPSRTPFSNMWPYTWFDWVADAMKSNLVLQSSAIDSASTDADYMVNHLDLVLDSLSSSESVAYSNYVASSSNYVASSSNLVLVSQNVTSTQLLEFAQEQYTDDVLPSTNGLASLSLVEGSVDGNPFETFEENLERLVPSFGRGSPNMVVIPEMTIGGIHVPIGQADFLSLSTGGVRSSPYPIPPLQSFIIGFCSWIWRLCCFVGIFCIVKQEWNYWSTLGGSASD